MIRQAVANDLDAILHIEQQCFSSDVLSRRALKRSLQHPNHVLLVAEEDGQVAGYLLSYLTPHHQRMRHYSLAVLPAFRSRSLARQLLQAAEFQAQGKKGMKLEIRQDNLMARPLYSSLGYLPVGIKKGYYEDGEDALVMVKDFA